MKIATFGAKGFTCQLPRIEAAFLELGHEIGYESPDFIYSNDPGGFNEAIDLKIKYPSSKLILNILDVPSHVPFKEFSEWLNQARKCFAFADMVTSISHFTRLQVAKYLGKQSEVIYNPIKPVSYNGIKSSERPYGFCAIGRMNDQNKRFHLVKYTIKLLENCQKNHLSFSEDYQKMPKNLLVIGSENPDFGDYLGVVSDEDLNLAYNSTRFCFVTGYNEGISLSLIEACVSGCIPVICNDMTTANEFAPPQFTCEPDEIAIREKILEICADIDKYQEVALKYGKIYSEMFAPISVAKNIINVYNSTYP